MDVVVVPVTKRPSASVTEIPGASAQPMRINEIGSFKPSIAMKGLKTGAMSRELVDKTTRIDGAGTSNFTVVLWFLLGLMCLGRCQSSCLSPMSWLT